MDTPDFISDEQMSAMSPQETQPVQQAQPMQHAQSPDFIPDNQFKSDEDKYGSAGQMAQTAVEGASQGLLGPIAPILQTQVIGTDPREMLARQRENPVTHAVGEAAGLGAGLMAGTGEAALMTKAGELAIEGAGLANLAKEAPLLQRVGSSAVQQAAEMAVMSAGQESSRMVMKDPEATAESAIANVGMAAALGGAGGAFITGGVSPLWKATAGPKVEEMLSGLTNHLNGTAGMLPEQTEKAMATLGIETAPEIRAGLSGNPSALERLNVLREVQNKQVVQGIEKLNTDASDAVMRSLGVDPTDIEVYSEADAGHKLLDTFKKEYKEKYEPIAAAFDKRNTEAMGISVADDARLNTYGKLLEQGMDKVGTDSPYYELYNKWGNRVLAKDTIGGLDQLKTEINGELAAAMREGNYNTINSLKNIKGAISDLQENQITKKGMELAESGIEGRGTELLAERALTNQKYAEFAGMSDDLTNHLGVGNFKGAGTLTSKLTEKISPEELLKKFSIRNNADFIPFLAKNFPETLQEVQANELKKLLKPAILTAKGEAPLNIKKLSDIINKGMSGSKEYIESIVPKNALEAINAARTLHDALPMPKSSGTAGWMTKTMAKMPQSAMAAVAMIVGHNPLTGYLTGEMAQRLGRHVPDAINLAYLKFLGSNQPIKSEGFKAMVDLIHNAHKGNTMINKAINGVFESGTKILTSNEMPRFASIQKLDKLVSSLQDAPGKAYALQNSDVGHYMPDHQTSLSETSMRALQYLQTLKPHGVRPNPLDKEIEPTSAEETRYHRALEIAEQPAIIMKRIKDGTLKSSDIQDLGAMYPALYKTMADKVSIKLGNSTEEEKNIPYKTRMSLSLFLGQSLDTSLTPQAMMAAQQTYAPQKAMNAQPQGATKKGTSALGKNNKTYQTPNQAAENHHANRK